MEHGARRFQSDRVAERFTPYPKTGSYGVTFMRPTDEKGITLNKGYKDYEYIHNGRGYKLNSDGVLRCFSPEAFNPTIKANLEKEHYLSELSTYLIGGDRLVQDIFGEDILKHCRPYGVTGQVNQDQDCNGLRIPAGLAKEDCTPSILRLFDPSMKEFLRGSAKLRAILSTYPVVPLGDLPNWDMSFRDAGEKGVLNSTRAADAEGAAPTMAPPLIGQGGEAAAPGSSKA